MTDCIIYSENGHNDAIISRKLYDYCRDTDDIVFVFIGTDCNIGDSLGPMIGQMLGSFIYFCPFYGSLDYTITANDVPYVAEYIKSAHPSSLIIAVDAALGAKDDIGTIKLSDNGIKPGLGVDKDLPEIGDISIIGVVGERAYKTSANILRLGNIYRMAKIIAEGIKSFLKLKYQSIEYLHFSDNKI